MAGALVRLAARIHRLGGAAARRPRLVVALVVCLYLVLLLVPDVALARGGGGGGSHGGGGSSGGGGRGFGGGSSGGSGFSSGGGGGGGFFFFPLFFGGGGGGTICCLIILAVIVYYGYRSYMRSSGGAPMQPAYAGPMPAQAYAPDPNDGLAAIKANDPNFTEQQFLDRAQAAFFMLQKAWQDRNVDEGRAYMSPGLYMGWKTQVDQMTAEHRKNVLEALYVQGMHIVKATHDDNYENITVRVDASAKDYDINDQTGKKISGDNSDTPFTEFWTFTRSAGAKTLVTGGITEKKCPNCGAPLDVNATGDCKYCGQAVTSGKFDWVLSKIDQSNEWAG